MLNFEHLDLDDFFEETYKISVIDFFQKYDETTFRKIESTLLKETLKLTNHVISTGGGTPGFFDNMRLINDHGISVYIKMHHKSLFDRLKNAKRPRPRTSNLDDDALNSRILEDMKIREHYYLQAGIHTKGENIEVKLLAQQLLPMLSA